MKLRKLLLEVHLYVIEIDLKLKYVYIQIKRVLVVVNHSSCFKWFYKLIWLEYDWFSKFSKFSLKMRKLTLEVHLFVIEIDLKLKYVNVYIKRILVVVNTSSCFKWFYKLILNVYH